MTQYNYLFNCRCLESMGEWGKLNDVVTSQWSQIDENNHLKISRIAAASAWRLNKWAQMTVNVECIEKTTLDGVFYRAVLSIHNEQYDYAQKV